MPDYDPTDCPAEADLAMLIIPGETGWKSDNNQQIKSLVEYGVQNGRIRQTYLRTAWRIRRKEAGGMVCDF